MLSFQPSTFLILTIFELWTLMTFKWIMSTFHNIHYFLTSVFHSFICACVFFHHFKWMLDWFIPKDPKWGKRPVRSNTLLMCMLEHGSCKKPPTWPFTPCLPSLHPPVILLLLSSSSSSSSSCLEQMMTPGSSSVVLKHLQLRSVTEESFQSFNG